MSNGVRRINPDTIAKPTGYTHVVEVTSGKTVFISGQVSLSPAGEIVGKGDMRAQAEQVMQNLKSAVEAAGGTMASLVKITTFVVDMSQLAAVREVRAQYLDQSNPPASTLLGVTALAAPDFLIEVEAIAVID